MELNNSKIISEFEINGKKYVILESEEKTNFYRSTPSKEKRVIVHREDSFSPESFGFDWPDPSDFDISLTKENGKICITITYDGDAVWKNCWPIPNGCINPSNMDIFTIEQSVLGVTFKITVYLRYISICLDNGNLKFNCQVWAREQRTGGETKLFPISITI